MSDPKHTDTSCSGDHNGPEQTFRDTERNLRDHIEALSAENERLIKAGDGDVGLIHWQGERIEQLEAALREVFEEWAGSEGFIPETAPEGYLLQLTKRMADIARAALGDTK